MKRYLESRSETNCQLKLTDNDKNRRLNFQYRIFNNQYSSKNYGYNSGFRKGIKAI